MIPWINKYFGIYEPTTYSMEEGLEEDDLEWVIDKLKLKNKKAVREKPIVLKGEIYGFIDLVIEDKTGSIAVEIKKYLNKRREHQITQLKAYAYLYNKSKVNIKRIILAQEREIVYDKIYEAEDHISIADLIREIKQVLSSEKPPNVHISSKCNSCWYKRICPSYVSSK